MSSLSPNLFSLWFRILNRASAPAPEVKPVSAAGERNPPDGGCIRGLIWAVLAEAGVALTAVFLAHELGMLHP